MQEEQIVAVESPTEFARAIASGWFDNAALFPPARAPMEASLALHALAGGSRWAFARGRFLVPAGALSVLASERRLLSDSSPLELGVIVGSPADPTAAAPIEDVAEAVADVRRVDPAVFVGVLEYRPTDQSPAGVQQAATTLRELAEGLDATGFVEVAVAGEPSDDIRARLSALERSGVGAKARCGGLEPGMVPSPAELSAFVTGCIERGISFKATAGLHHALASDEPRHGFLNLLVATALADRGDTPDDVTRALTVTAADRVAVQDGALTFGDVHVSVTDLERARLRFTAFGTCSFTEPLADLVSIDGMTTENR